MQIMFLGIRRSLIANWAYIPFAVGIFVFSCSCVFMLFRGPAVTLGAVLGFLTIVAGFLLVLVWTLVGLTRRKRNLLLACLVIGAAVVLPFRYLQSLSADQFFRIRRDDYDRLYELAFRVPSARDIRLVNGRLRIKVVVSETELKDPSRRDSPPFPSSWGGELASTMVKADCYWVMRNDSVVECKVGGLFEANYGFLKAISDESDSLVKRQHPSWFIRPQGDGWYFYIIDLNEVL